MTSLPPLRRRLASFQCEIPRTAPLLPGTLVKRYKRFFADIALDGGPVVTAHCVNTGAMEGLTRPGTRVWVSEAANPSRKLRFTWELAEIGGSLIGVDTGLPNRIVGRLLRERAIPWLSGWDELAAERKYGERSRVDFWMRFGERAHFLEVKNCHLAYPDRRAYFPDCVSDRAAQHLRELLHCVEGERATAEVLFFVQTSEADSVRPSDAHDPVFSETARRVCSGGVCFSAIGVRHEIGGMAVSGPLPVDMKPYGVARVARWRDEARMEKQQANLK